MNPWLDFYQILSYIYNWDRMKYRLKFCDLDLIFQGGHLFSLKALLLVLFFICVCEMVPSVENLPGLEIPLHKACVCNSYILNLVLLKLCRLSTYDV